MPDNGETIPMALRGAPLVEGVEHHAELPSTQQRALALAAEGAPHGALVLADRQTAGRGRHGHGWHSPPGGLWLSLVLRPRRAPTDGVPLTLLGGLAALRAVHEEGGLACALRWPNDLMCGSRKLGGVLVDVRGDAAIMGLGLNVRCDLAAFPEELRGQATSLAAEGRADTDLPALARAVLTAFAPLYARWEREDDEALVGEVAEHIPMVGARVRVLPHEGAAQATAIGTVQRLGPRGELIIAPDDGTALVHIYTGKVEVL
jgi:BirA family biotin operon repressor/biotin-[acetyl-CoA-carboxylase] ligase